MRGGGEVGDFGDQGVGREKFSIEGEERTLLGKAGDTDEDRVDAAKFRGPTGAHKVFTVRG